MRAGRFLPGARLLFAGLAAGLLAVALQAIAEPGRRALPAGSEPSPQAVRVTSALLLPLRVADPAGGPPWGLRLLHTTRGWVCLQVGRVQGKRFGELGIDGAFAGDGRLHPTPPGQLSGGTAAGAGDVNNECLEPGETFAGQIGALDRSAAFGAQERAVPRSDQRQISFGLLGRYAVSVTHRSRRGEVTSALLRPYGAYLIVERLSRPGFGTGVGAAPGDDNASQRRPAGLTGALTSILYDYGRAPCRRRREGPSCFPPSRSPG